MGKRSRNQGEGSIRKRANGSYEIRLRTASGRRSWYTKTKSEATQLLVEKRAELGTGLLSEPGSETLAGWTLHWLKSVHRHKVADSTLAYSTWVAQTHVLPRVGKVRLSKVSADVIERILNDLEAEGVGSATRRNVFKLLRQVLGAAVKRGKLPANPCAQVEAPKAEESEARALSPDEVERILVAAEGTPYEALWVLLLTTGMRFGEVAGLTWGAVDLDAGIVRIVQAQREYYDPSKPKGERHRIEIAAPKTDRARRSLHIGEYCIRLLRQHRELSSASPMPHVRVFRGEGGQPLRRSNITRRHWQPLLERAGVSPMTIHGLRHTSATAGLRANVPMAVVSARLGHATPEFTMRRYQHETLRDDFAAAEELEAVLIGGRAERG